MLFNTKIDIFYDKNRDNYQFRYRDLAAAFTYKDSSLGLQDVKNVIRDNMTTLANNTILNRHYLTGSYQYVRTLTFEVEVVPKTNIKLIKDEELDNGNW